MKLRKIFPGSFKEEMADFTMTLDPFNDIVRTVTLDTDDDGTLVFTVNGVRSKKPPPEWDEMNATLTKGRDMVLNYKGNADEVDISVVKNLTDILKNAGKDPDIAERVITLLNHYGTNDENLKKIERAGGIEALIEALRQHPDNDRLAKALLLLLDKFCDHDVFKTRIGKAGAVEVILSACNAQSSAAKVANGRSLPKGWVAVRDPKSNKTYYYNTVTKETTWDRPADFFEPLSRQQEQQQKKDESFKDFEFDDISFLSSSDSSLRVRTFESIQSNEMWTFLSTSTKKSSPDANIIMEDVYDKLPVGDPDGGAWKQGWKVTYDHLKVKGQTLYVRSLQYQK